MENVFSEMLQHYVLTAMNNTHSETVIKGIKKLPT